MNHSNSKTPQISIVLPCLNEEQGIRDCLDSLLLIITQKKLSAEILIIDNGSTDKTAQYSKIYTETFKNIIFLETKIRGYGSALMKGFEQARGEFIYMADCDGTYNFSEIPLFIHKLEEGYEMVIGNRFTGLMEENAMPFHKKYIGNPVLSFLTRLFFKVKIHDIHCGARAFKRNVYSKLSLHTLGMEFASEMIIKAAKEGLQIVEIPISYNRRIGESKLNTFIDGWRHLRFLLLYSPLFLFLLPGIVLCVLGVFLMGLFYFSSPEIFGFTLYTHPMFLFLAMIIIGYQLIFFSFFSKIYSITHLEDRDLRFEKLFQFFTIEKAIIIGTTFTIIGLGVYGLIFINWIKSDFGSLNQIKNSVVGLTSITIGVQTIFSGFMLSILGIKEK